jgi:hypothetical protein
MERINKATLLREILPEAKRGVEISRKTACGSALTFLFLEYTFVYQMKKEHLL